jgi:signal transduction histidine kinase
MNCDRRTLMLEIRDDEIGGSAMAAAGFGLKGMADRASGLGDRLAVVSPEREGTSVRAEIPVDAAPP